MSNTTKHILYAVSNISLSREQLVISTSLHMHVEAITAMYDFAIGNLSLYPKSPLILMIGNNSCLLLA